MQPVKIDLSTSVRSIALETALLEEIRGCLSDQLCSAEQDLQFSFSRIIACERLALTVLV